MFISQSEVQQWFSKESIQRAIGHPFYRVEEIAIDFLCRGGHRWRPFLFAGVYQGIVGNPVWSDYIKHTAMAIECFHKASLIHDDIEDDDKSESLHRSIGIPQALNVGDYLIHIGYSFLAQSDCLPLISVACGNQLLLCYGQGEELYTKENNFARLKTVPLFEMSFRMAVIHTGCHIQGNISEFSRYLGEAYQALDDLRDGVGSEVAVRDKVITLKNSLTDFEGALSEFLSHYINTMFDQSAAAAAASSADIAPTAASLAP